MNTSSYQERFAVSSAVYFNYSIQYAIKDLSNIGYEGIEIWGGRPHMYRHDLDNQIDEINNLLTTSNLKVCNFIPAQFRYPSILCSENEQVRRESIAYIESAMDNAIKIGSPSISLCPGMVLFDREIDNGRKQLIKSFQELSERNSNRNLLLLIEPAHRFETNLILTIEDCLRMIDEQKFEQIGILLDTGHCHINGEDFRKVIDRCKGVPLHIHIDDNFGDSDSHLIPGKGNADLISLAESLTATSYQGYISAELGNSYIMNPTGACRETLKVLRSYFEN